MSRRHRRVLLLVVGAFLVAGVATWCAAGVGTATVASHSMEPTLAPGDRLVLASAWGGVHRRDIVVVRPPGSSDEVVKRVVGVAGDRVGVEDGVLTVNGRTVAESFVDQAADDGTFFGPVTVPASSVFVLGDNRTDSWDSRQFGCVPLDRVRGIVLFHLRF